MSGSGAPANGTLCSRASTIVLRNHIFCGVVVVGFANGASDRVAKSFADGGVPSALLNMFGIGVVAWAALAVTIWLLLRPQKQTASRMDYAVSGAASLAFLLPVPQLSWLALAGVAFYVGVTSPTGPMRRAAVVLGALTIPMLWARILFAVFGGTVLAIDAKLVSWIVGTHSEGNAVPFADGSGVVFLLPACSSLTNVSLALLCGVVIVKLYDLPWSVGVVRAVLAACLATVIINVARISSIGILPTHYDLIHGPVGLTLAEWMTNLSVVAIYAGGLRPDVPAHA
jgi:hypothetical protein